MSRYLHLVPRCLLFIYLDKKGKHKSLWATIAFARSLRKYSYTKIYSLHRSFRSTVIAFSSGVKETYGYSTSACAIAYKHRIPYRKDYHEVQRHFVFLDDESLIRNWRVLPEMHLSDDLQKNIKIPMLLQWDSRRGGNVNHYLSRKLNETKIRQQPINCEWEKYLMN